MVGGIPADRCDGRLWLDACVCGDTCRVVKEMVTDVCEGAKASRTQQAASLSILVWFLGH
jgi:hypothetical protein